MNEPLDSKFHRQVGIFEHELEIHMCTVDGVFDGIDLNIDGLVFREAELGQPNRDLVFGAVEKPRHN